MPEKVHCKDCKFRPRIFRTGYCTPHIHVDMRINDYYSPNHYVRKITYGTYEMRKHNANKDCGYYRPRR